MVHIFIRKSQLTSKKKKRVVIIVFSLSGKMKNRITSKKGKNTLHILKPHSLKSKLNILFLWKQQTYFVFVFFLHNGELSPVKKEKNNAVYVFNVKKNRDWQSPE